MKKYWFILIAAFVGTLQGQTYTYAAQPVHTGLLQGSYQDPDTGRCIFYLQGGYFCETIPFSTRWRTLSEWWNDETLPVPDHYKSSPRDWNLHTVLQVYDRKDCNREEADRYLACASNKTELATCTHLLRNPEGLLIFAYFLAPQDAFSKIAKISQKGGYDKGYKEGHSSGYSQGQAAAAVNRKQDRQRAYDAGRRDQQRDHAYDYYSTTLMRISQDGMQDGMLGTILHVMTYSK